MISWKFLSRKYESTIRLGTVLSRSLKPGSGALLSGELGSGKTTLITGICRGLGVTEKIKSPTFTLENIYQASMPIHHADLYRLNDPSELENIGWEDMADESGIYLVEWADRFTIPGAEGAIKISLEYGEKQDDRIILIEFDESLFPGLERDLSYYKKE
jgi:tRNA threonylcarbamoyladenosine biosynthesis protein TsaE